jgi:hypothetical protein
VVKATQLLSTEPVEVQIWHGTAVTANGFAVRYQAASGTKLRFFTNAGDPVGPEVAAGDATGSPISDGGGRGEDVGFNGNGKDAYVLATKGTDENGQPQIWVAVLNADGSKRWARNLGDATSLPHVSIGRVDAAIDASGRVAVVYADKAGTADAGGTAFLVLGRLFDAQGNPLGGVFHVSEKELPVADTLDAEGPRIDWRGNTIAVAWESKNLLTDNPDAKPVVALRSFKVEGGEVTPIEISVARGTDTINLSWTGGNGPFLVQGKLAGINGAWTDLVTTTDRSAKIPLVGGSGFLRVQDGATKTVKLFKAILNGANERPNPVVTPATGVGLLALEGDKATYFVSYSGLTAITTAAHVHGLGTAEEAKGVLFPIDGPLGATAGLFSGVKTGLPAATVTGIETGMTYFNIHTQGANSGGEIRGQILAP